MFHELSQPAIALTFGRSLRWVAPPTLKSHWTEVHHLKGIFHPPQKKFFYNLLTLSDFLSVTL